MIQEAADSYCRKTWEKPFDSVSEAGQEEALEYAEALLPLFPAQGSGTIAEWFKKGQESVLRRNQSGCCCKIDDSDNVLSVCGAHQQWLEDTVAAQVTGEKNNGQ